MVESLTNAAGVAFAGIAQWILTLPGINTWLQRFLPGLAAVPRSEAQLDE